MKWFDKWFYKKTKQMWETQPDEPQNYPKQGNSILGRAYGNNKSIVVEHEWTENLNISITTANGGRIVSFRRYDRKTDRNLTQLYVIPEEMDFNHELGKLITLEAMRG